ncbi:hypothetical protein [Amycolatopsis circi]|nr:hypothetical protein [Amycolatopsis circi]
MPSSAVGEALEARSSHVVLGLSAPFPTEVAQRVADELIAKAG